MTNAIVILVVEGCSTTTGSQKLMGALLKSLELTFLFIAIFIGEVILPCTMHEDEGRKDVIDVL
jgi:hypothetical protein